MPTNKIRVLSSLGLLLAAVIWGFAFVVVKNSLDLIPPIYMLAFRFTIAAAALTLIMFPKLRNLTRRDWTSGAVLGFFLFTAHAVQTIGCQYTTAGKNAFLTTIYVIIVPFLHWIMNRKRP
ncbi:MAG: DMT family transporter, partial [Firmicutes bacterium]|nr:DMT family transporter [Bacillota bacterium]